MEKPVISFVVAMGRNTRAIGRNNGLLWKIPEDQKFFKDVTMGHPMIMGRKTFDSIGRVLPGRTSIVVTRDTAWKHEGVTVCHSIEEALQVAKGLDAEEITIIGGAQIFTLSLPYVTRLYLTLVDDDIEADTYFPEINAAQFSETSKKEGVFEGRSYVIRTLERVK